MAPREPGSGIQQVRELEQERTSPTLNTGTYHALIRAAGLSTKECFKPSSCEQFSPIWAENYQETSYPVAVFEWTAHNPTHAPITSDAHLAEYGGLVSMQLSIPKYGAR